MPSSLRITAAGRALLADGDNRGVRAVELTKLAIGDANGPGGVADDARTTLRNQRAIVAVGGSTMVSGRIAVHGVFIPDADYSVTEIGVFGRSGGNAEILLAYWSAGGEKLASTVSGSKLLIAGSLDIAPAEAEITVNLAPTISLGDPTLSAGLTAAVARIAALEGRGYATLTEVTNLVNLSAVSLGNRISALEADTHLDLWSGTQAEYDALQNKNNHTLYVITA